MRHALAAALTAGAAILADCGTALDAVEAAVRVLEDDPHFNAGRGAVLAANAAFELDAAIMEGAQRRAGAIAGARHTRNPVSLARAVMDRSPHVFLVGRGADIFSVHQGLAQVAPDHFRTERRVAQLAAQRERGTDADPFDSDVKYGTVGAVARDVAGHLAAATSTGGLTGKMPGRVGDSPVIGAGTYADDRACAVSATGSGEIYLRQTAAHEIAARIRFLGEDPQTAADHVQMEVGAMGGTGGIILVGRDGTPAWSFNSRGMFRAMVRDGLPPYIALHGDE